MLSSGKKTFAVKVVMPRDITTVIQCDQTTTADVLIARSLGKLRRLLGIAFDRAQACLVIEPDSEGFVLDDELVLSQMDHVRRCLESQQQPTFRILYDSVRDLGTQLGTRTEISSRLGTEVSLRPPGTEMSLRMAHSESSNNSSSTRHGTEVSVRQQQQQPIESPELSRRMPAALTLSVTDKSQSLPVDYSSSAPPETFIDEAGVIRYRAVSDTVSSMRAPLSETDSILTQNEVNKRREYRPSTMHAIQYTKAQVHVVEFVFLDLGATLHMEVMGDESVSRMKSDLWNHPNLPPQILDAMDEYRLRYQTLDGEIIELFDEDQIFHTISTVKTWLSSGQKFRFLVIQYQKSNSKQVQLVNKKIGNLIGYGLYRFDYLKDSEVDIFRRNMVRVRQAAMKQREPFLYTLDPELASGPVPLTISNKLIPSNKITFRLHVTYSEMVKTLTCQMDETPEQVIQRFIPKNKMNLPPGATFDQFCLKVCGMSIFFVGPYRMIDFAWIRKCILKDEKINLTLFSVKDLTLQPPAAAIEEFETPIEDPCENLGSHAQLTIEGRTESQISTISLWDIARNYRIQVTAAENLNFGSIESIYVEAGVYHNGVPICPILKTHQVQAGRNPRWAAWLNFDIACYNLPRTARLCFTVWGRFNARRKMQYDKENDLFPIGWVSMLLMDYKGYLKTGMQKIALWPGEKANPIGTCVSRQSHNEASLYLKIDTFAHPVIFPTERFTNEYQTKVMDYPPPITAEEIEELEGFLASDPLVKLDHRQKQLIWTNRYQLMRRSEALPKLLLSARWNVLDDVIEVKKLLPAWAPMTPEAALELLDANFGDIDVRAYAVSRLELLTDRQVLDFLLQLVQVLKYEPYLDCALARFLLRRALKSRSVGHYFFWYLRSEMEDPTVMLRFALLLEAYLRGCGHYMDNLIKQNDVLVNLSDVALSIKRVKTVQERKDVLEYELQKANLPSSFELALDPKVELSGVLTDRCKYMDSKKLPLWCVFSNTDPTGQDVYAIFKSGDDLRQDMLTLQLIRIMDSLWQENNLDLRLMPYKCVSTGAGVGLIEVVLNAETVSNIQLTFGGSSAAFQDQPIDQWLRKQNPDQKDYEKAVETFTLSCAGYCVATYVLGIGDRHNDNIMVTRFGHLFHIDFGHFLGNIKRKFGFKRERAPFVLTPDFVYVMGKRDSEQFKSFINYCVEAYLILRRHAHMFINLFAMMLSTGIPELKSAEDIYYLRGALCLGKTEEEAAQEFRNLIFESLRLGWSTQLNWWLHNLAHSK